MESSAPERDSDSTKNQDAKRPSLPIPPNIPPAIVDKIESHRNACPVFYYNYPMDPMPDDPIQDANPSSICDGKRAYNNLSTQDSSSTEKKSDKSAAQMESSCCLHQNPTPCVYCAMRLQDGDLRALCRRDPENESECCIECAYAGHTCTWVGVKLREQGSILVQARSYSIETVAKHGLDSPRGKMVGRHTLYGFQRANGYAASQALCAMQSAAAQYLAAFRRDGNVYDLIGVQRLYNSSRAKRQRMITRKKISRKRIQKRVRNKAGKEKGKDVEISSYLNQGSGLVMGHLILLREIMSCNRQISERLQKSDEILRKLLTTRMPIT
ncbi:hypothetical protein GGI43DRAFT_384926 [Trichoderma evansii]